MKSKCKVVPTNQRSGSRRSCVHGGHRTWRPHHRRERRGWKQALVKSMCQSQHAHADSLTFVDRPSEVLPLYWEADLEGLEKAMVLCWVGPWGEDTENSGLFCRHLPWGLQTTSCAPHSLTTGSHSSGTQGCRQWGWGRGEENDSPRTLISSGKGFVS